jgi:hypothetical protein
VAHAELVDPLAQRLQPFSPRQIGAPLGENESEGNVERCELRFREVVDPYRERFPTVVGLENL